MPSEAPAPSPAPPAMRSTMGVAALLMAASVLLSRIIGLLREQFVAWKFGATGATDVYLAAFTLPDFLNYLLAGGALSITFVPIFSKYLAEGREDEGSRVFSIVVTFLALSLGIGILSGELLAGPVVSWFFSEIPPERLPDLVRLTRIVLPAQLFHVLGSVVTATLLARGSFTAAAFAPILYNLGIIAGGLLLGDWLGVEGLAWGVIAGALLGPFLVPLVQALRGGLRFSPSLALSHPGFKRFILTALPLMLGASLVTVDEWIARRVAAGAEGTITHLNYARKLMLVPMGLLAQAGGVASYPFFARLFAEGKLKELGETVVKATRTVAILSILVTGAAIPLALPAISVLFQHGLFDAEDAAATAPLFIWYIAGLVSWGVQALWSRACYAAGDTLRPMLLSTAIAALSYPAFYLAYGALGAPGLALASTAGISLQAFLLAPLLRKHIPELSLGPLWNGIARALLIAALAGGAAHAVNTWALPFWGSAGLEGFLRLLVGGLVFLLVALPAAKIMRLEEIEIVWKKIRRRLPGGRGR